MKVISCGLCQALTSRLIITVLNLILFLLSLWCFLYTTLLKFPIYFNHSQRSNQINVNLVLNIILLTSSTVALFAITGACGAFFKRISLLKMYLVINGIYFIVHIIVLLIYHSFFREYFSVEFRKFIQVGEKKYYANAEKISFQRMLFRILGNNLVCYSAECKYFLFSF